MKSVKIFGKSVPLLTLVMVSILIVGASAVLLTRYGTITSTVTVAQSLNLDDLSSPASDAVTETIGGVAGDTIRGPWHHFDNMADKVISASLASTKPSGLKDVYPEFKLDSRVYDDAFRLILHEPIAWADFTSISFDYEVTLVPSDPYNPDDYEYIPQINIALRDGDGKVAYYASWHTFRTHIEAEVGPSSVTYPKGEFFFFEVPSWDLLGFYANLDAPTQALIDACDFEYFSHQAGETSNDPNTGGDETIVLVSNHVTDKTIVGIGVFPGAGQDELHFRMVYIFEDHASPDDYTVITTILPLP